MDAVDRDALSVWLQPLATVITGLFALMAAIVAYRAVTRQIQANAKNVQAQIDAAAAQQQKNREAEWAMLRRKEVLDLVLEAVSPARVMGPLVCHEHGTGLSRFQAVRR